MLIFWATRLSLLWAAHKLSQHWATFFEDRNGDDPEGTNGGLDGGRMDRMGWGGWGFQYDPPQRKQIGRHLHGIRIFQCPCPTWVVSAVLVTWEGPSVKLSLVGMDWSRLMRSLRVRCAYPTCPKRCKELATEKQVIVHHPPSCWCWFHTIAMMSRFLKYILRTEKVSWGRFRQGRTDASFAEVWTAPCWNKTFRTSLGGLFFHFNLNSVNVRK